MAEHMRSQAAWCGNAGGPVGRLRQPARWWSPMTSATPWGVWPPIPKSKFPWTRVNAEWLCVNLSAPYAAGSGHRRPEDRFGGGAVSAASIL